MSFKKAILYSFMLHLAVVVFISYAPTPKSEPIINAMVIDKPQINPDPNHQEQKAIEAVSIDAKEIEEAVHKLKQEQDQANRQRLAKIAAEKRAAEEAKRHRIEEEKRLATLKREAKERAEQQRKEQQRLAALKKEREKLQKQQQEEALKRRLEEERKQKAAQEAERQREQAERRREEALQAAKAAAAKQARVNEALQKYKALILQAISQQWILPANVDSQLSCEFRIRLAPDGTVVLAQLSRSSGDTILDRSAESAINKASPLPVPQERELFELFRDIQLTVRPEQARG
jgi:colicin import membrane protein